MGSGIPETETVVKRILPYLRRRGYDDRADLVYESGAAFDDRYAEGFVDLLVKGDGSDARFLIEAKRASRTITRKDEHRALASGRAKAVPFVVVTNGRDIRSLNTNTGQPIRWGGALIGRVPRKDQLPAAIAYLRQSPQAQDVPLGEDESLPFRPGLPLRRLNALFAKCHTWIRNIEKREDEAFADLSMILFLKLLEEKADLEGTELPYRYRFWELAEHDDDQADRVKHAITTMVADTREVYGDVLQGPFRLKNSATFLKIVRELSSVSFTDSEGDVKGVAFEYFVRATLRGKRLGQYFTPRPLVDFMVGLVGRERVFRALESGAPVRVVDPACGTGGFLVYMQREIEDRIGRAFAANEINAATRDALLATAKTEVFYGADANEGVASAAKMNMVIAGDGHTNIATGDSLRRDARVWNIPEGIDLVITNPPFGTSEADSLTPADVAAFEIPTTKGQLLFLQRMIERTKPGGTICTVIDEGVLNTDSAGPVRRLILEQTELRAVVQLPPETFKPNKINVRSAVLLMEKREHRDTELTSPYTTRFIDLESLGYDGSGIPLRGFDFGRVKHEVESWMTGAPIEARTATAWSGFGVDVSEIAADPTFRFDHKYWEPETRTRIDELVRRSSPRIKDLNLIPTSRGKSPAADLYVDSNDGYARVLKAGSSITNFGEIAPVTPETDFIEKNEYDKLGDSCRVVAGDVLLSSTGSGTLGKCAVWDHDEPALADAHITIIRVDRAKVSPHYLADYLRTGFGSDQIERLYTGSTGLIELTPGQVNDIVVELPDLPEQRRASEKLRETERAVKESRNRADTELEEARLAFAGTSMPLPP